MFRDRIVPAILQALRTDAAPVPIAPPPVEPRNDSIYNSFTGLGGDYDKGRQGSPVYRAPLAQQQLEYLYHQEGYPRKIVDLYADWPTKEGWALTGLEKEQVETVTTMDRRLNVWTQFGEGLRWANLYGGSAILVVTDDGAPLSEPLNPRKVRRVLNLVPLDANEATPATWNSDPTSQDFRLPATWNIYPRVQSAAAGWTGTVDASRVIYVPGLAKPPSLTYDSMYSTCGGLSLIEPCWDAICRLVSVEQGGAVLSQEMRMDVLKVDTQASRASSDAATAMDTRLMALSKGKGLLKMIVLGTNEDFVPRSGTVSGYGELHDRASRGLCAVSGVPAVLMYGDAPSGLNTDGASWQASWSNTTQVVQANRLYRALVRFYSILLASKEGPTRGKVPENWDIKFNPIFGLAAQAEATLRKTHAETDAINVGAGILDPVHVARSRYSEAGYSSEILPMEDLPDEDPDAMEEAEAEMEDDRIAEEALKTDALDSDFRTRRFTAPPGAKGNAKKVLDWRRVHGSDVRGMTSTGWARARQLASDDTVPGSDIIVMAAWFARHGADPATKAVAKEYADEPWRDAGYVSWLGWGGDTAETWATETVDRARKAE